MEKFEDLGGNGKVENC